MGTGDLGVVSSGVVDDLGLDEQALGKSFWMMFGISFTFKGSFIAPSLALRLHSG